MKLEQYIRENRAAFDNEIPPQGSEERFLNRLEHKGTGRLHIRRNLPWMLPAAAAAAAIFFMTGRTGVSEKAPEAIYENYIAELSEIWQAVGPYEEESFLLRMVTDEAIPLTDLLPEELSENERAEILDDYYGTLLENARKIKNKLK